MTRYLLSVGLAALFVGSACGEDRPDALLNRAFPDDEASLRAPIKVHWRAQGIVITAATAEILPDGRVRVTGFAFAQFPAGDDGKATPATARSPIAVLTLDAPVRRITDLAGRKLVSAELDAGVGLQVGAR